MHTALTLYVLCKTIGATITLILRPIRLPHELQRIPTRTRDKVRSANCRGGTDLLVFVRGGLIGGFLWSFVAWVGCG